MSEYYDFDTNVNDTNYARGRNESFINTKNGLSKVFLLMFLGLLVTAGVAIGFPYLLASINLPAQTLGTIYLAVVIISAFSLIILSFVTNYVILKSKKGGIGMFMTYAVVMGFFLSFFILAYDFSLIG
ncbi:MAG: hypothetical protein K6G38_06030, partial [Gammaproteobacteria bacterium]|nr:hypothetical protein [Gammaproteobacteria bacterium]